MSATGPWIAGPRSPEDDEKDWEVYFYEGEEDGEPLIGGWVCEYVTEANARLIAAAPDLRELLDSARDKLDHEGESALCESIDRVLAATQQETP